MTNKTTSESSMYLTRGGNLNETNGAVRYAAQLADYWTSTTYASSFNSNYLLTSNNSVQPSASTYRYYGFTVGVLLFKRIVAGS